MARRAELVGGVGDVKTDLKIIFRDDPEADLPVTRSYTKQVLGSIVTAEGEESGIKISQESGQPVYELVVTSPDGQKEELGFALSRKGKIIEKKPGLDKENPDHGASIERYIATWAIKMGRME